MRIPSQCDDCDGRALTYATVRHDSFIVRYRKCDKCHKLSKSIQMKKVLSSKPIVEPMQFDATMPVYRTTNTDKDRKFR